MPDVINNVADLDKHVTLAEVMYLNEYNKKTLGSESIGAEDVERILLSGFTNGQKRFSDDGTVITSTDLLGRTLTKTFTNEFQTCTTVLANAGGTVVATLVKTFSADGKEIESVVTYAG